MSETTLHAERRKLTLDLAAALGTAWTAPLREEEGWHSEIQGEVDGIAVELHISRSSSRTDTWHIAGWYVGNMNGHMPYGVSHPALNVSKSKSAAQIARDVTRRLLPDTVTFARKCYESKKSAEDYDALSRATAEAIIAAGKAAGIIVTQRKVHGDQSGVRPYLSIYDAEPGGPEYVSLDFTCQGDGVRFEHGSLGVAVLARMIAAMKP